MAGEYQYQSNVRSDCWSNGNNLNNPTGRSSSKEYESERIGVEEHLVELDGSQVGIVKIDDSVFLSSTSTSVIFRNTPVPGLSSYDSDCGGSGGVLVHPNMQIKGLGLSSEGVDLDQEELRFGGKADQNYRSISQEDHISSSLNFPQEIQWKAGIGGHGEESSLTRGGFSLEQPDFSSPNEENSTTTCHNLSNSSYTDNNSQSLVPGGSPSNLLQSLLGSNNNHPQQHQTFFNQRSVDDYSCGIANNIMNMPPSSFLSRNKFPPQFVRTSPPSKQQPTPQSQLQFSNNAPYWNASSARVVPDVRESFMPSSLKPEFPTTSTYSSFGEKPKFLGKNNVKVVYKDVPSVGEKSGSEASAKRSRNELSATTLTPFKAKKEKMGDRITALQQLVSPFGKTDTASVLSESIEYIKILHEQVHALTTAYLKNGAMMQLQHQHSNTSDEDSKGPKHDMISRWLCIVPLSSTFPVTHETSVDYRTPSFGGPLR